MVCRGGTIGEICSEPCLGVGESSLNMKAAISSSRLSAAAAAVSLSV